MTSRKDKTYKDGSYGSVFNLRLEEVLINPDQPRREFSQSSIEELAASIEKNGLIQPIIVRREAGKYHLIAGERRLRAVRLLGHKNILAIVKNTDDRGSDKMSLIENIQRVDLNPIEEALAYKRIMEDHGMTQRELAEELGKSRSYIGNSIRLLKLDDEVLDILSRGEISIGHAKALLALEGEKQIELCKLIIDRSMTVRETEAFIRDGGGRVKSKQEDRLDPYLRSIEDDLRMHLGTKVRLVQSKNKGKIEIEYYSEEDLSRILDMFK